MYLQMYKSESDGEAESSDSIDHLLEETDIPSDEEDHLSEGESDSSIHAALDDDPAGDCDDDEEADDEYL